MGVAGLLDEEFGLRGKRRGARAKGAVRRDDDRPREAGKAREVVVRAKPEASGADFPHDDLGVARDADGRGEVEVGDRGALVRFAPEADDRVAREGDLAGDAQLGAFVRAEPDSLSSDRERADGEAVPGVGVLLPSGAVPEACVADAEGGVARELQRVAVAGAEHAGHGRAQLHRGPGRDGDLRRLAEGQERRIHAVAVEADELPLVDEGAAAEGIVAVGEHEHALALLAHGERGAVEAVLDVGQDGVGGAPLEHPGVAPAGPSVDVEAQRGGAVGAERREQGLGAEEEPASVVAARAHHEVALELHRGVELAPRGARVVEEGGFLAVVEAQEAVLRREDAASDGLGAREAQRADGHVAVELDVLAEPRHADDGLDARAVGEGGGVPVVGVLPRDDLLRGEVGPADRVVRGGRREPGRGGEERGGKRGGKAKRGVSLEHGRKRGAVRSAAVYHAASTGANMEGETARRVTL